MTISIASHHRIAAERDAYAHLAITDYLHAKEQEHPSSQIVAVDFSSWHRQLREYSQIRPIEKASRAKTLINLTNSISSSRYAITRLNEDEMHNSQIISQVSRKPTKWNQNRKESKQNSNCTENGQFA